jgi:quinol monooxygenase YgiN
MTFLKTSLLLAFTGLVALALIQKESSNSPSQSHNMLIRIAEIKVNPSDLEQYLSILKEESEASMQLEPGVIAIFPMYEMERPNEIRILEIYANKSAYESHLLTPHFLKYKTTTREIVQSLTLTEMEAIDPEIMPQIFNKLKR